MRLLGLDPGLRHTGWGVLEVEGNSLRFVACGVVDTPQEGGLAARLECLYAGLGEVVRDWRPAEAAVEETVVNVNALSSLKLGHARGVVLLAAAHGGLPVAEYASKQVKRAVTGTGAAGKEQVGAMVRMLLPGCGAPGTGAMRSDAADALAVAICHAHLRATRSRLAAALAAQGG